MHINNAIIFKMLLTTFILFTISIINREHTIQALPLPKSHFKCPETTSCVCSFNLNYYEIECPPFEPGVTVRVQPSQLISIECAPPALDPVIYTLLPNMSIGDEITHFSIRKCPLPGANSLYTIAERLGLTKIRTLVFLNYGSTLMGTHFSDFKYLERLILNNNGLTALADDLFLDVENITWLDLRSNKVHLSNNIFAPLHKLEFLELGYNNLEKLEPGVFRNQKNLKHLNLWGNQLGNITKESFDGATSITDLDLSLNKIEYLPDNIFESLINLNTINLNANHFKSLPSKLFSNNKNLTYVKLMDNRVPLPTLPNGMFANLTNLLEIKIRCDVEQLPEDLFMGANNLSLLFLSKNKIQSLPKYIFADQTKLTQLDLSYNELVDIADELFVNTHSLTDLNLSYNKLINISGLMLRSLRKLRNLNLNHNNIITIHREAFAVTTLLQTLDLQSNQLDFIEVDTNPTDEEFEIERSSPFQSLGELETLNLRNNSISSVLMDWTIINTKLRTLDLSYNNITFLKYTDLQFLAIDIVVNFTHNNIAEIDLSDLAIILKAQEDLQTNKKLTILIDSNPIRCDCVLLYLVEYLNEYAANNNNDDNNNNNNNNQHLNIITGNLKCASPKKLHGTPITSLKPKDLLCPLDSPNSSIQHCPKLCNCLVRPVDKTLIINCSNTHENYYPLELPKLTGYNYTELYLNNNYLTNLPIIQNLPGYEFVTELYANNNNVSELLWENIPPNLKILELKNNNLESLNVSVFEQFNKTIKLERISLGQNPWKCDCNILDLFSFIHINYKKITDLDNITCSENNGNGKKLSDMNGSDLCPEDQTAVIIISTCIAIAGMLIGIIAALYYKYQQEIKVWLFAHNLCLWFVTEDELDKDKKYDAFISYSHLDETFITDQLVPELENGPHPFKLCLHIRDWVVGEFIPNQIAQSVEDSRRTIVVLSPNFMESIWGRMEFRAAHNRALIEGRARVIVIIYGEIGTIENLDPELKAYLTMNTYVKWGDPFFWNKLRYAMPHPQTHQNLLKSSTHGLLKNATIKNSVDDKLELIKPVPITPPSLTTPPAEHTNLNHHNPLGIKFNNNNNNNNNNNVVNEHNNKNGNKLAAHNELNGHVNGAFIINTNAKQSDV